MQAVLRRIAIQGGLTGLLLAIVGVMLAEVATTFLTASIPSRGQAAEPVIDTSVIKTRLPLVMACWGFTFVAAGECLLHAWRSIRRSAPVTAPLPPPPPDATEKLLEELLAQAEAKQSFSTRGRS